MTLNAPADPEQDRVEVPDVWEPISVTVEGERVQVSPVDGEIEEERSTVPVKPLRAVTLSAEFPLVPAFTVIVAGLDVIVKGVPEFTVTVALFVRLPLAPETITVNVPGLDDVHDRVEAPVVLVLVRRMLVGRRVQASPAEGETVAVKLTVPVNPF